MIDTPFFLDSNIIMYCFGKDHPLKEPCKKLIDLIRISGRQLIFFMGKRGVDNRIAQGFQEQATDWIFRHPDTHGFLFCGHGLGDQFCTRQNKGIRAWQILF